MNVVNATKTEQAKALQLPQTLQEKDTQQNSATQEPILEANLGQKT